MAASSAKFNLRNPAVKRIMQEMKEIQQDTSGDFVAEALETDIFEWHFVIRGPPDTEFEGGIYHGRILLPADYPFKPPSFMLLTPNGRFETNMKICLTISNHHPEAWQPSWSVRTALVALIAFMPSPANGALGALEYPKEERRTLAARSRLEAPRFGNTERQAVIDDMHRRMLAMAAAKGAQPQRCPDVTEQSPNKDASGDDAPTQVSGQQGSRDGEGPMAPTAPPASVRDEAVSGSDMATNATAVDRDGVVAPTALEVAEAAAGTSAPPANGNAAEDSSHSSGTAEDSGTATVANGPHSYKGPRLELQSSGVDRSQVTTATGGPGAASKAWPRVHAAAATAAAAAHGGTERPTDAVTTALNSTDHALTAAMFALSLAIAFMVIRKVMSVVGYDFTELVQLLQMLP